MTDNGWFEGTNNPGAGDVGQLQALQANLAGTAEAARRARSDLSGLKDNVTDAVWRGLAATEFKQDISSKFLGQLAQLDASYQDAADGFAAYIGAVADIKGRAASLSSQIYAAIGRYEAAARALQSWRYSNPHYASAPSGSLAAPAFGHGAPYEISYVLAGASTDPGAASTARLTRNQLQRAVEDAWNSMQSLYRQMDGLKQHDRTSADNAVISKLKQAHGAGMKNESSWHHFFRVLATVAKWVAVALVVIAIVAVIILAPEVGIMAALAMVSSAGGAVGGLSLGAVLIYGGVAASAVALTGDVGQRYSEGDKPGWATIGMDALGLVPGLGTGGRVLSRLGEPAEAMVTAVRTSLVNGKAYPIYFLGELAEEVAAAPRTAASLRAAQTAIANYGHNVAVTTAGGAAMWAAKHVNGLWTGAGYIDSHLSQHDLINKAATGLNSLDNLPTSAARYEIGQLHQSDARAFAHAHEVADNLAQGNDAAFAYPKQFSYPQGPS